MLSHGVYKMSQSSSGNASKPMKSVDNIGRINLSEKEKTHMWNKIQ